MEDDAKELDVPVEKVEKLVRKIKQDVVNTIAILYDQYHAYDPNEFKDKSEVKAEEDTFSALNKLMKSANGKDRGMMQIIIC